MSKHPEKKPTFGYIENNLTDALDLFLDNKRNVGLGGILSAITELLGRVVRDPNSDNGRKNFKEFLKIYLKPLDSRYYKYADLIYSDLRNGSAHSVLPKGGVSLSYDPRGSKKHLAVINRNGTNFYQLFLYSPKLIMHWKRAMLKFTTDARKNPKLSKNYIKTLDGLWEESQIHIKRLIDKKTLSSARTVYIEGDIKA